MFSTSFERLYNNIEKYDMELPAGMLAYRVLKCVGILANKQQLARATIPGLTYNCMKKQLKAIYDNISQENNLSSVKVEPVFEARGYNGTNSQIDDYYWSNRGQNNSSLGSQERVRFGKVETNQNGHGKGSNINNVKKRNRVSSYSKVTCFSVYESIYHWAKNCLCKESDLHKHSNVTLFTQKAQKCFVENFSGENSKFGSVDSGCTKAVSVE